VRRRTHGCEVAKAIRHYREASALDPNHAGSLINLGTAHLMVGLFVAHDRNDFEMHAHSYGRVDHSRYRKRIVTDCDRFIDPRRLVFSGKLYKDRHLARLRLASDAALRRSLQEKLARQRLTQPLFDTARFARNLERAYRAMWELYLAGAAPRPIEVVEQ